MRHIYSCCNIGQRQINQDYIKYVDSDKLFIAIVADGLGSYKGSEVASKVFCEEFVKNLSSSKEIKPSKSFIQNIIERSAQETFTELKKKNLLTARTSFASIIKFGEHVIKIHIGDCRIYTISSKRITKTKDHYYHDAQLHNGHSNILDRSIGIEDPINPDIRILSINEQDLSSNLYLLASDGFWANLDTKNIRNLYNSEDKKSVIDEYINMIEANGLDEDNFSFILAEL